MSFYLYNVYALDGMLYLHLLDSWLSISICFGMSEDV